MPAGRRSRGLPASPEFIRLLRELQLRSGLTQAEFGARFNVRQSYVSQLLKGIAVPSRQVVEDICRAYDVDRLVWLPAAGFSPQEQQITTDDLLEAAAERGAMRALRLAGYSEARMPEKRNGHYDGRAYYTDRMRDLAERYGPRYARVSLDKVPDQDTPREVVDLIISTVEEDIKREIASTQEGIDSGKP